MANVLIRGVSDAALERLDSEAAAQGLSRNEYLRRKLEVDTTPAARGTLTAKDWARSAATFADLADPDVMDTAWQ